MLVFSLFDGSGYSAYEQARLGHQVICFNAESADHGSYESVRIHHENIQYVDVWIDEEFLASARKGKWGNPDFVMAFPPCTDLAGSGSRHWAKKAEADPEFQIKAAQTCQIAALIADHFGAPYCIENPVGRLSTLWRKPDYIFNPCDYGGWIRDDEFEHPAFPGIIPARDAYKKKTCIWTGNGYVHPHPLSVPVPSEENPGWKNLGGKSAKTKLIRSLTPRGFARAVALANSR